MTDSAESEYEIIHECRCGMTFTTFANAAVHTSREPEECQ